MHALSRVVITIAALFAFTTDALAHSPQQEPASKTAEVIAGLSWMNGTWVRHDNDGQHLEETWSTPDSGAMVGMFRWNRGGKPFMCELMSIAAEGEKVVFRLRHFDIALKPWEKETPLTYPMSKVGPNEIAFEDPDNSAGHPRRFVYKRAGDQLTVRLENADGGGDDFVFRLKSNDAGGAAKPQAGSAAPSPMGYEGGLVVRFLVTDRAKSREWYREMLGFEVLFEVDEIGWTEMSNAEAKLTIGLSQSDSAAASPGTVPVVGVKDLDAARKHLESKGVKFTGETIVHAGLVKLATLLDPDGHQIMLYQALGG
jgi:catechol 2,3-dioxygenase-like lactoylglutathione lyase family enzyme